MNARIAASLLLLLLPISISPVAYAQSHKISLSGCEKETNCIPMLLDISQRDESSSIKGQKKLSDGYTIFELSISGVLNGKTGPLIVYFTGYTDGIECTAFGQGLVGFLGYSNDGYPIINSSDGPLEILSNNLIVGCKDCIKQLGENNQVIGAFISPSWDISLTGNKKSDFFVDKSHNQYFIKGNQCLQLPPNNLVRQVERKMCTSRDPPKVRIKIEISSCS